MDHEDQQASCQSFFVDSLSTLRPGHFTESKETSISSPPGPRHNASNLRYLPIGSLVFHVQKLHEYADVWVSIPADFEASQLSNATSFSPLLKLLRAKWVRAELKRHNRLREWISFRVFILPDDVGRSKIAREDVGLRKAMWELISSLDKSAAGWKGDGNTRESITTYRKNRWTIHQADSQEPTDESLLYIFNTLPNPAPESSAVSDVFSRDAMETLLDSSKGILGLRGKLFSYQRRSAAVMIQREVQPAKFLDPRFKQCVGPTGDIFYLDERAGCLLSEKRQYDEARGGILAETMGIGKTLICLALVLCTKGHWPKVPPQYSTGLHAVRPKVGRLMEMAAATIAQNQIPWKAYFENHARGGEHYERCVEALQSHTSFYLETPKVLRARRTLKLLSHATIKLCPATLVVVPANLLAQWRHEIYLHVEAGFLSVLVVDDLTTAMPQASQILRYDIVLIERKRFEREILSEGDANFSPSVERTQDDHESSLSEGRSLGRSKSVQGFNDALKGCSCSWAQIPHSPLKCLHFLRLIVDEGHNFAASGLNSNSAICMQELRVERRWIVSGTPANGLLGTEVDLAARETSLEISASTDASGSHTLDNMASAHARRSRALENTASALAQEKKDLKSLGNIVVNFLALPPWANLKHGPDHVSWDWYVVPPKGGGEKNSQTLRNVLASLIVRHQLDTVKMDIQLPQLCNRIVYLQPCFFDKLSINLFILKLASNAITSERKDRDYMFHLSNRKQLDILINNLRKSCFFWTGFTAEDVSDTVQLSQKYSDEHAKNMSMEDTCLMETAIKAGTKSLKSSLWRALSKLDEIGLCVSNFPTEACEAWSLNRTKDPLHCIIGATQLGRAVKFIDNRLYMTNPAEGLSRVGEGEMEKAEKEADKHPKSIATSASTSISPQKIRTKASKSHNISHAAISLSANKTNRQPLTAHEIAGNHALELSPDDNLNKHPRSALKPVATAAPLPLPVDSSLLRARLTGTVSAKLSYLMDRVTELYQEEKILIFYDGDYIAYYIAQALELIGVQHLIYTNSLEVARRNRYVLSFTTTETFRVMLMDLRQAAHGLHVACASRVFFVNPVWQPNIEAQAIKRAHRIGQRRPVFVETLVLENTLEDQMLQRRKTMTTREQQEASRSLLDDLTMTDIIKNAQFIPLLNEESEDENYQCAPLKLPQQLFGRWAELLSTNVDLDKDLIVPSQ